ncbi:MAG: hypothetical protein FJ293_09080 [Planctomycetes bacterium]|nr:hypothetical protein [Planctomycetota bacterium]
MATPRSRPPAAASRALLALAAAWLLPFAGCRSAPDLAWKRVVIAGVDRAALFEWCRQVVVRRYAGTQIRIDAAAGKIETGEVEAVIRGKVLRQRCAVDVQAVADGHEIALLVPLTRREFDPAAATPVTWVELGSDVVVEGLLLEEICGLALARDPDAAIVSTDLPQLDSRR